MSKYWLRCLRCRYRWLRRSLDHLPRLCPACKTYLWNTPRTNRLRAKKKAKYRGPAKTASLPRGKGGSHGA